MVKVEYPYVQIFTAKGRTYSYYRRDGTRLKIDGEFGTAEWRQAYDAIHRRFEGAPATTEAAAGTIADGLKDYQLSDDFRGLKKKTRSGYERYITLLTKGEKIERDGELVSEIKPLGHLQVAALTPPVIKKLRSKFAGDPESDHYRPSAANGLVTFCNVFVSWFNSEKIKKLKTGDGHRPAEEDEIRLFRERHPADTLKRVAFELALNTGQRGQDVIAMGRPDMRDGEIRVVQEKTGERVWIPMTADLKAVLEPWMKDKVGPMLTTPTGRPMKEDYFRHMMREAYDEAGLPEDFTTHGLRYTAATRIFEVYKGLGHPDRMAWEAVGDILGHRTMEMAKKYSAKRRRARLTVARLDAALGASVKPAPESVKPNKSERTE